MAFSFKNKKTGKEVVLLNPSEKGAKYARELKSGVGETNKGLLKLDKNNKIVPLTDTQKAFRSGYLRAQKDSANAYKAKLGKGKGKKAKGDKKGK